jgi:ABC-type transport system involved in cytochrome c biogenesis ATPase subunit
MRPDTEAQALVRAEKLALSYPGVAVFKDLSFELRPGLTLIRGGDGRGKTGLLQILAGVRTPAAGVLHRMAQSVLWVDPTDDRDENVIAEHWLQARRAEFDDWDAQAERGCIEDFALAEHLHKSLFMLSSGTRRKLGLAAAFASGAHLVLLDMPCAALDTRSCEALVGRLGEMAHRAAQSGQAWVIADYELPEGLMPELLSGVIDLGD